MIRIIWETTGRARDKTGAKWVIELRKDWTQMRIKIEGKEINGAPIMTEFNEPEECNNRVGKQKFTRQGIGILKISEEERKRG